ncbi:type II toxin-antitoxin system RelE/ParE family toxin [Phenylobacterium sp.]|uniref:type II toxin-antitoxin system RelE/ParE family toxin n=1 Tax=Phenylobacterium sp. TaxID=1871053 RepID=UPI0027289CC1|nr:type II toxin-antitoxin system RelE/ParE family toxin [Phenylobacterium sp.]MDO8380265.1 type II toxin-antitoxin system RelE/ParE family toxin [Phenylobacterium sp.]
MRLYKNGWFEKYTRKEKISDQALCDAVSRAERGLVDADLGGGLIKQRVARPGAGRSGGYRVMVFYRSGDRAVFVYGFAKSDRANLNRDEVATFQAAAKVVLGLSQAQMTAEVAAGRWTEMRCDDQDL